MRWIGLITVIAACGFRVSATGTGDARDGDGPTSHDGAPGDGPADASSPDSTDAPSPTGDIQFIAEGHGQHADSGHDTVSATLSAPTSGHSYIAVLSWYSPSVSVQSLTDSVGNTYVFADGVTDNTITQRLYYVPRTNVNVSTQDLTVTATWTGHAQYCEIRVLEYAGLAATSTFDKATATAGSNDPVMAVGPIVTAGSNELLLGSFTGSATGAGATYTSRILFMGDLEEDRVVQLAAAYSATATAGAGSWVGQIAAFKGE